MNIVDKVQRMKDFGPGNRFVEQRPGKWYKLGRYAGLRLHAHFAATERSPFIRLLSSGVRDVKVRIW